MKTDQNDEGGDRESEKQQHQQWKSPTIRLSAQKVPNSYWVFLCLYKWEFFLGIVSTTVLCRIAEPPRICDEMRLVTNSTKYKLCRTTQIQRIECEKTFLHIHLSNKEIRKYKIRLSDSSNYKSLLHAPLETYSTIWSQVMCVCVLCC